MPDIDLDAMPLEQLSALQKKCEALIAERLDAEVEKIKAEIVHKAQLLGITPAQLTRGLNGRGRKGKSVENAE